MQNDTGKLKETAPLVPIQCRVSSIIEETDDIKTFCVTTDQGKPFNPLPGQLAMLSLPDTGEAMFSVSSQGEEHLEFSIKKNRHAHRYAARD